MNEIWFCCCSIRQWIGQFSLNEIEGSKRKSILFKILSIEVSVSSMLMMMTADGRLMMMLGNSPNNIVAQLVIDFCIITTTNTQPTVHKFSRTVALTSWTSCTAKVSLRPLSGQCHRQQTKLCGQKQIRLALLSTRYQVSTCVCTNCY